MKRAEIRVWLSSRSVQGYLSYTVRAPKPGLPHIRIILLMHHKASSLDIYLQAWFSASPSCARNEQHFFLFYLVSLTYYPPLILGGRAKMVKKQKKANIQPTFQLKCFAL